MIAARSVLLRVFTLAFACLATTGLRAAPENFDHTPLGPVPDSWLATKTGSGRPLWSIVRDDTAPSAPQVLRQSGEATYPVCLKREPALRDGFVEVKFKAISGREDQAGGVIWRALDADNYYVARANALEDNVTIYHTIKGRRVAFKNVDVKVAPAVWHTLRVNFVGPKFTVIFDGRTVIEATDTTLVAAGLTGLWTKADSVTHFDDFASGPVAH